MSFRAKEKLVPCPYNTVHQILPHRMAQHLIKCAKQHPDADMKKCPFNATHVVPTPLLQAHIDKCPDRSVVDRDIYRRKNSKIDDQQKQRAMEVAPSPPPNGFANSEDWDSELVDSSYNPDEHMLMKEVARKPTPGMGKAARKEFRQKEITRIQEIRAGRIPAEVLAISEGWEVAGAGALILDDGVAPVHGSPVMRCDQEELRRPRIAAHFGTPMESSSYSNGGGVGANGIEDGLMDNVMVDKKQIIKQKRLLEKRLVAIEKLEKKISEGHSLSYEERVKVDKKEETEYQLALLLSKVNLE